MRSLVVVAALVLASCASSTQPPAASAAQSAATSAAPAASAAAAAPAASPTAAGPAFGDLLKGGKLATYKVSYKWTVTGQDGSFDQTWIFKPPKARIDWKVTQNGTTSGFSLFELESGSYFCSGEGSDVACLSYSGQGLEGNQALQLQQDFEQDPTKYNATLTETRTIAGQRSYCYTVGGIAATGAGDGSATACYTDSGVPMLIEWKAAGQASVMEATSYSTSVSDADFTLPATPMKVP